MSKPTHNVIFKARSYTDQEGQARNAYQTIGAAWPDESGHITRIKIDTIPVNWDGSLYLRERDSELQKTPD